MYIQIQIFGVVKLDRIDGGDHDQHAQRNGSKQFNDVLGAVLELFFGLVVMHRWREIARWLLRIANAYSGLGRLKYNRI